MVEKLIQKSEAESEGLWSGVSVPVLVLLHVYPIVWLTYEALGHPWMKSCFLMTARVDLKRPPGTFFSIVF